MKNFNYTLLRLVREQRALSQTEVATRLGVRQAVFSKYENGSNIPPEESQKKLSEIFHYPLSFFQQDSEDIPIGLVYHRKRTSLLASLRNKIEAEVRLRSLDILKMSDQQKIHSNIIGRNALSPNEMASAIREHWHISTGPIDNLIEILEENGIIVIYFDFNTDKLDGFFLKLRADLICIALNSNEAFSADRNRFTLAHELGHALLHGNILPDKTTEKEADEFASAFLLPENDILPQINTPLSFAKLMELKRIWKVSIGAIIFRAHKLGAINDFMYRKLWTFMSASGYRKKEPECNIARERPRLLGRMLKQQKTLTPDLLSLFHLQEDIFNDRYDGIMAASVEKG